MLEWTKHETPNSNTVYECCGWYLPDELAQHRFSIMSSWSVLAVWAARFWSVFMCVCVCDWWVWERVCKYSVTQESNVAARGFLMGSIVVEGDMFSWGKARPVLSPPPTPETFHSPPHTHTHIHSHPHPGEPSTYNNYIRCIKCTVKDRAFPCSILPFNQL